MNSARAEYERLAGATLGHATQRSVVVVGDFTIDTYFDVDPEPQVAITSVETGAPVQIMRGSRFQPGGAGNVVANLRALGAGSVRPIGITGNDEFAAMLHRHLDAHGVETSGLVLDEQVHTAVYAKTIDGDREVHRFDIGSVQCPSAAGVDAVIRELCAALDDADVVIVNQQVTDGWLSTQTVRDRIRETIRSRASHMPVVVDSRDFADTFGGCIRKLNQLEAFELTRNLYHAEGTSTFELADEAAWNPAHTARLTRALADAWATPVVVTRGEHGAVVAETDELHAVEGVRVAGPIDTVGAGDSFTAGLALALSAKAELADAARFATLVSAVTVGKQHTTGTAAPDEVAALVGSLELNYAPEALYAPQSGLEDLTLEVISRPQREVFAAAVFDHDGTISTLREGWEAVMKRHMASAIMGDPPRCPPEEQARVIGEIERYIRESTGVQTIVQMTDLVGMVERHGLVETEDIQAADAYKAAYTSELRQGVATRLQMLSRGLRTVDDFTIRGAVDFLRILRERGIKLYLASGTDEEDVVAEAHALGYGEVFERIRGSVGNAQRDPKRIVLEELVTDLGKNGRVLVVGDGPVEMRVGRRYGATTVGVLSDEVRRYGWNTAKRARQISAGAHVLVPDFTDADRLLAILCASDTRG